MRQFPAILLAALAAAGCDRDDGAGGIDERRILSHPRPEQRAALGTLARMGLEEELPPKPTPLAWTLPAGWSELPASQMRAANFSIAGSPGVECYLTLLSGGGGGLDANVNRWRGQAKLAPLSAADIAALPTLDVLGRAAPFVECLGAESGILGVVCDLESRTLFVKMTGPAAAVAAERERFVSFCRSLTR